MNLLGRSSVGLLFLSALFFFSCDDELNKIGSETGQDKFDLLYEEFVLPSKVVLFDSIRTDNTSRLLVGEYIDPIFGNTKSTAYSVYGTNLITAALVDAVIDSVYLNLKLDFYHYGRTSDDQLEMSFNVHQITEKINSDEYQFNYSEAQYDPLPLGNIKFRYYTDSLDLAVSLGSYRNARGVDSTLSVSLKLPKEYVFDLAQAINTVDTLLYEISDHMFGLALVPELAESVIGFQTSSTITNLRVYYHTSSGSSTANSSYDFTLNTTSSYNQIESDRSGTPLEALNTFNSGEELDGTRYIQGASGIYTQVDLDTFLVFTKTLNNILINSAEIVIDGIVAFDNLTPPTSAGLLHANDEYKFDQLVSGGVSYDFAFNDQFNQFEMLLATDENELNVIGGFPTLYFQSLYDNQVEAANLVIVPSEFSSSLHRTSFDKGNIKLRVYYTEPTPKN